MKSSRLVVAVLAVMLGSGLALGQNVDVINFHIGGNLGTGVGAGTNGVLVGSLTATAADAALLETVSQAVLAYTNDGGLYADDTTDANDAGANDVPLLPAVPAVNDATYWGHATAEFDALDIVIGTAGVGTWTLAWEAWDGDSWELLADIVDGTTAFTAAAGTVAVTWTLPSAEDPVRVWEKCTVDGVNAYWVRARVATYAAVTTQPQGTQMWALAAEGYHTFTDDTTDFNDAGAGDVALLPAHNAVGDAFYAVGAARFASMKTTTSQARTGTATLTWEYWNGTAYATLPGVCDIHGGWAPAAGTNMTSWVPPADWVACTAANGPNGEAGYVVRCRLSALTSVTAQPLLTQGWLYPLTSGEGITFPTNWTIAKAQMSAQTASGANNDTKLLLVNRTTGAYDDVVWTKTDALDSDTVSLALSRGDELVIQMVGEDKSTEFADVNIVLSR